MRMLPFLAEKFSVKCVFAAVASKSEKIEHIAELTKKRRNSLARRISAEHSGALATSKLPLANDKTFFLFFFIGSKLNKSLGLHLAYSSKLLFPLVCADAIQQVCAASL